LQDKEVEFEGIRIYGSPWTPTFFQWFFMKDRGPAIRKKWDLIPQGIDILVTHGPPIGYGDFSSYQSARMGDEELREAVDRIRPKLHVFGHNHGGYGESRNEHTLFVNASSCDEGYNPSNAPVVVDWPIDLWS
jgi:Icc-related predicted phosphoesterase